MNKKLFEKISKEEILAELGVIQTFTSSGNWEKVSGSVLIQLEGAGGTDNFGAASSIGGAGGIDNFGAAGKSWIIA